MRRKVGGGEAAVPDADLVRNFQALQVGIGIFGDVLVALDHVIEQVVIGKNRGEQLAVVVAIVRIDALTFEPDFPLLWRVEPQQQLDQRGLGAAVFANDENDVALLDGQVHRAQAKRITARCGREGVADVVHCRWLTTVGRVPLSLSRRCGSGEENWLDSSAIEGVDRAHLGVTDEIGGALDAGVDGNRQHHHQPVAAVALDLFDGRREYFFPQRFAQFGNDVPPPSRASSLLQGPWLISGQVEAVL